MMPLAIFCVWVNNLKQTTGVFKNCGPKTATSQNIDAFEITT